MDMGFSISDKGTAEKVEIAGYSRAMALTDEWEDGTTEYSLYAQKEISESIPYMNIADLVHTNRYGLPLEPSYYYAIIYSLTGTNTDIQTLMDMMATLS